MPRGWWGVLLLVLAGCQAREAARVPVRGQVRFREQAVTGGAIVFAADTERGTPDELAIGQIQADGSYVLQTKQGARLAPGWYRVSIAASSSTAAGADWPEKYRDPLRSGLACEVRRGQENVVDFNLR